MALHQHQSPKLAFPSAVCLRVRPLWRVSGNLVGEESRAGLSGFCYLPGAAVVLTSSEGTNTPFSFNTICFLKIKYTSPDFFFTFSKTDFKSSFFTFLRWPKAFFFFAHVVSYHIGNKWIHSGRYHFSHFTSRKVIYEMSTPQNVSYFTRFSEWNT